MRKYYIQGNYIHFCELDKEVIKGVKDLSYAFWNYANKEWAIQLEPYGLKSVAERRLRINKFIQDNGFTLREPEKSLPPQVGMYDKETLEVAQMYVDNLGLAYHARDYQLESVVYNTHHPSAILADDMGLGKTFESILYAEVNDLFPCLVITLSGVKKTFASEWNKITKGKRDVSLLKPEGKLRKNETNDVNKDVVVVNYDLLVNREKGAKTPISKLGQELAKIKWKAVICDESHFIKNMKSKRTKATRQILKGVPNRLFMTGTAVENRVMEIWSQLCLLGIEKQIAPSWEYFVLRYANGKKTNFGWDTSGYSNLMELHEKMRKVGYLRRSRGEVMKDLPEEQEIFIHSEITNRTRYNLAKRDIIEYKMKYGTDDDVMAATDAPQLVQESEMKKLAIEGKMTHIKEILNEWSESTFDKLVVFGIHRDTLIELADHYGCDKIIGGVDGDKKVDIVNDWKTNDKQFLFCNVQAGGTGVDGLQDVCCNMLIIELPEKPSTLEQMKARIRRGGQKYMCTYRYVVDMSTTDALAVQRCEKKTVITEQIIEGVRR